MTTEKKILLGDVRETLPQVESECVQTCITSPPYWGLRSYLPKDHPDKAREIGQEKTLEQYIAVLVQVFREVKRVLKPDGTLWLNLGDAYTSGGRKTRDPGKSPIHQHYLGWEDSFRPANPAGLKNKDLMGIPWRAAFALQADGWYLRNEIIWAKKSCRPQSVKDRCVNAHEHIFLFSRSPHYYFDAEAIREPASESFLNDKRWSTGGTENNAKDGYEQNGSQNPKGPHRMFRKMCVPSSWRNKWDVWFEREPGLIRWLSENHPRIYEDYMSQAELKTDIWNLSTCSYAEAHFATFPPELIKPCILAGSKPGDTVLDPFLGSSTTGEMAFELGRSILGCELNADYNSLIQKRTAEPSFAL